VAFPAAVASWVLAVAWSFQEGPSVAEELSALEVSALEALAAETAGLAVQQWFALGEEPGAELLVQI
jgi:hypothetical protein